MHAIQGPSATQARTSAVQALLEQLLHVGQHRAVIPAVAPRSARPE